ncbi:NepR family anti-sigma factor [Parerythrobacter lacustris]|uniref:NepR family anti-sigma factor n=1 Tax=Parerythrobacter lacustris TaxID=2969984 RepID=A0ABT1XM44_9SPHN|nr:NepR family anti-sigma factor [Parerythrobacter lacustris]MCR2832734.1 NepR family anti-sigma factor [Parerythrobacter lacustris]
MEIAKLAGGMANTMKRDKEVEKSGGERSGKNRGPAARKPGWASGLQQLYDSVIEEPLPDSFKDLLSRLDDKR